MRKALFFAGIVLMVSLTATGCSFLYEDTSEQQSDSVIDVSQADEPWEMAEFEAVNQFDEEVTNESLEGEWWLTKTIFTRCPTVCMTMTPNMAELQEGLADEGLDVSIVSFTVDPEFDTPERLENYGESYGADFDSWDFITGYTFEDITDWALESMKASIQKVPEQEDIMHPTRFYLVNPDGVIVRMYSGENNFNLEAAIEDIQEVTGL